MKKGLFIVVILLFEAGALTAQQQDSARYLLTSKLSSWSLTSATILDPYLSPLNYTGFGLSWSGRSEKYLSVHHNKYSSQTNINYTMEALLNPAFTSEMLYAGMNCAYGVNYHFVLNEDLKLFAGGLWDIDLGFKNLPRNINNSVNFDMATNFNLSVQALFNYELLDKKLRFRIGLQSPLIGCMFVPQAGASYYDMFELGHLSDAVHFSSLHNKTGLDQVYSVDVPFKTSTWRFALHFRNLRYKANGLVFKHESIGLSVGTTFDVISFSGTKKVAPAGFRSIYD